MDGRSFSYPEDGMAKDYFVGAVEGKYSGNFPLIIPVHLWERANAIDSTGFLIATIVGPPLAASLVAFSGPVAFVVIGLSFGVAALVISGAPDPPTQAQSSGSLLVDSWQGVVYTWQNRTLRALALSISTLNLTSGTFTILVPLIVLQRLHLRETVVGILMAVQGVSEMISAIAFGGMDSRNPERIMLALPMAGIGIAMGLLLLTTSLPALVSVMAITGIFNGPVNIALFTLRQRRTDPNWTGRAFAVSVSLNTLGIPVGSAIAGFVATRSIEEAIAFGVVASLISGCIAAVMIPSPE